MSTTEKNPNVKFYTMSEFKTRVGIADSETAQVVKNPNTNKVFLSIGSHSFKCQQDIDGSKELRMLVESDNLEEACLVNTKPSTENVLFTI